MFPEPEKISERKHNGFAMDGKLLLVNLNRAAIDAVLIHAVRRREADERAFAAQAEQASHAAAVLFVYSKQHVMRQRRERIAAFRKDRVALEFCQMREERGLVTAGIPVDGVLIEQRWDVRVVGLLPVVDHRQPALEEQECRPVPAYFLVRQDMGRAGAVVVFKEAQLDVVIGIDPFLRVKPVGILRQANLTLQIVAELMVDIVIIACVERLIEFSIGQACKTLCAGCDMEAALDRFTQP